VDRATGASQTVAVSAEGATVGRGAISGDGTVVAYWQLGTCVDERRMELLRVFDAEQEQARTITERQTICDTGGYTDVASMQLGLSDDGDVLVFDTARSLHADDGDKRFDVYAWHGRTDRFQLVSDPRSGLRGDDAALGDISADGRWAMYVADVRADPFCSTEAGERGLCMRLVVRDLETSETFSGSVAADGGPVNADVLQGELSGDGRYLAFATEATNVIRGRPRCRTSTDEPCSQVYLRDLRRGRTFLVSAVRPPTSPRVGRVRAR
jgi:hypothetical protein